MVEANGKAVLSNEINLVIEVCHFPPATSKWNKIEHRLFSQIAQNWRGKPLLSYKVIVNLIPTTTGIDFTLYPSVNLEDYHLSSNITLGNYPNLFNSETTICFSIPGESKIELVVFNIMGQKIRTLINNKFIKGKHSVVWDGKDNSGKAIGSGIYFYQLKFYDKPVSTKKMILL